MMLMMLVTILIQKTVKRNKTHHSKMPDEKIEPDLINSYDEYPSIFICMTLKIGHADFRAESDFP
jgi:hypothetical protein